MPRLPAATRFSGMRTVARRRPLRAPSAPFLRRLSPSIPAAVAAEARLSRATSCSLVLGLLALVVCCVGSCFNPPRRKSQIDLKAGARKLRASSLTRNSLPKFLNLVFESCGAHRASGPISGARPDLGLRSCWILRDNLARRFSFTLFRPRLFVCS